MKKIILFVVVLFATQNILSQTLKSIKSPGEQMQVTIFSSYWGVPGYFVIFKGDTIVVDSQLGVKYSGSESTGHIIDKTNFRWMKTDSTFNNAKYNEIVVTFNQAYKGVNKVYARVYDNAISIKQSYQVDNAEKIYLQDDNFCVNFAKDIFVTAPENNISTGSVNNLTLPAELALSNGMRLILSNEESPKNIYPEIYLNIDNESQNKLDFDLKKMYEGNDLIKAVLPASFDTPWIRMEIKD